ncbi:hypothetical protein [Rummeliibacillus pycnus]|uniref:hypothetical protein n=1 Tax=Rummeliibacillus pycnus TaxID=101070 RepID=UPI003D2AB8D2
MKLILRRLLLLFIITFSVSSVAYAEQVNQKQGGTSEGIVVYHVKYDYNAISKFLGISRKDYEKNWNEGLSIADMAEKQGMSRKDIEGYFYNFHYKEMQKWRAKGVLTEKHYFHLVYNLTAEIEDFINRNPNRIS